MKCESVIYLDSDFLSKKYEDCYDEAVMTSLIREEGLKAGIRLLFVSGGAHTKEIKSYDCSVYGMLKKLLDKLEVYPALSTIDEEVHNKIGWIDGRLFVRYLSIKGIVTVQPLRHKGPKEGHEFMTGNPLGFLINSNVPLIPKWYQENYILILVS